MKVKELIEKLKKADPDMLVMCTSNTGEFDYCIVNTAGVRGLRIEDEEYVDDDDETDVFVIDEQ